MPVFRNVFSKGLVICFLCALTLAIFYVAVDASSAMIVDVCANVYHVVDGDTFDAFPVGRIRLADVNAPEISTPAGLEAKKALAGLIEEYGPLVYLDVDDVHVMDRYYRIVAVVYLRVNETHLLNVNKWIVENGYAEIWDYVNEFNPNAWELYLYQREDPCRNVNVITSTVTSTIMETSAITRTVMTTVTVTDMLTSTVIMVIKQDDYVFHGPTITTLILFILITIMLLVLIAITRKSRSSKYRTHRK